MGLVRSKKRIRIGVLGAALAMTTALAGAPAFASEETPTPGLATAETTANAVTAPASTNGPTLEQIRTAMSAAEAQRVAILRSDPCVPAEITEQWGVEVIRVASTANGLWLDFRFRVTDEKKALPLFDSRIKPYLESEQSGVRLAVPTAAKVGALRTTNRGHNIKPDKIYAMMFGNPGFHVKRGQKVSVVIGDFKVEHLTVY